MRAAAWCWLALAAAVVTAPAGQGVSRAAWASAPQLAGAVRVPVARGPGAAEHSRAAWRLVDLASGRTLDEGRSEILALALTPGSIVELATLIAALEAGVITPRTRMACPGSADVAGRRVACVHPRMRRPLSAAEALAHSCHVFFAGVGLRLPRARLDGVLAELGLPPAPPHASPALAAAGLEASPVPPEILLRVIARVVSDPPAVNMRAPTRAAVMSGLRGAASVGTAAAFEAGGVRALAKTGTALSPGGGQHGLVVAAWPAARPTRVAVVVIAGKSGAEAADLAARLAQEGRLPPPAVVAARPAGASVSEAARADVPAPRRPEANPGPASFPVDSPHAVPAPVPTAPPRPAPDARPATEPPPLERQGAGAPAPMRSPMLTTRVRLLLPAQDEPHRPTLTTLAEALLGTVSARAGRSGPREVHVVFHPTSRAFQRATRQPWWSAGSTRGSRIDLQPISVLRERGTLEETLAHEFGHLVTAPVVRGRPLWVAEGAAMYVAGLIDVAAPEVVAARGTTLSCPSDAELKSPETAAAMKDAYGRARACFERALGSGQRWEDVP